MDETLEAPGCEIAALADGAAVCLSGRLGLASCAVLLSRVERELPRGRGPVSIDLGAVAGIDGGAVALLIGLRERIVASGREVSFVGAGQTAARLLALLGRSAPRPSLKPPPGGLSSLAQIGKATHETLLAVRGAVGFVGALTASVGRLLRRPNTLPWSELPRLAQRTGADGLPIVFAINFLVGTTLALQGAIQLRQYGLDVYVADSVALATSRSLGPLMTAIIVAGRSGAGFAAELGTMKVSEEIDALRTLGLDPIRYLALPRIFALVFMLPLLTLLADLGAILGGLVIGVLQLGITVSAYVDRTGAALSIAHVFSGVLKSVFFGLAIGVIACQRGLATEGGAEGVGRSTTSTVVSIIFALVVLEALFTSLFDVWGI